MVWWTNHLGNPNCWSFNPVLTGWISQKNADFDCEGISQNFNNWGKQCHKPAIWELFYQHYIILVHIIYIHTHQSLTWLTHHLSWTFIIILRHILWRLVAFFHTPLGFRKFGFQLSCSSPTSIDQCTVLASWSWQVGVHMFHSSRPMAVMMSYNWF